jgi:hypothetical protein
MTTRWSSREVSFTPRGGGRVGPFGPAPEPGLIHHGDRGVQYACGEYRVLSRKGGVHGVYFDDRLASRTIL